MCRSPGIQQQGNVILFVRKSRNRSEFKLGWAGWGKARDSRRLACKVVLLNFWASLVWSFQAEIPDLIALQKI